MPAPLLWFGMSAITLLAGVKYSNGKRFDEPASHLGGNTDHEVAPINGAVVSCGVYGLFEHSGIWVDGNILELKGNGLIRSVSPKRFLQQRSGDIICIACNHNNIPLIKADAVGRAMSLLFSYSEYDVINNNCHKFVWHCLSGEYIPLTRFSALNQKMAELFTTKIHWHPALY
jgi:hypothetical protein